MAIISRPHSARIRFTDRDGDSVQTWSRIHPDLHPSLPIALRQAINSIRPMADPVTGGFYIVTEELVEADSDTDE
ncbi:MAG: hypothetical protein FWF79_03535 [Defluviitaleaceae bacterium]|nr:hypothetical protein [Defluviitaleaceae bacterium]